MRDINCDKPESVFCHPYLAMLKRLHEKYGTKVQLDLFYETEGFTLSDMTDRYKAEWQENCDWLRFGFHARAEHPREIYKDASFDEVRRDCEKIHNEIIRFAGRESLSLYTSVHYVTISNEGKRALRECGIKGIIDLFAFKGKENQGYKVYFDAEREPFKYDPESSLLYFHNDMIINLYELDEIPSRLKNIRPKPLTLVMIHEQYFYEHYHRYQPDYAKKLEAVMENLTGRGARSVFLDQAVCNTEDH